VALQRTIKQRKTKPKGFWQPGGEGFEVVARYVRGEIDEDDAVIPLRKAVLASGVEPREDQISDHALLGDLRWYAREVRRSLGLAPSRDHAQGPRTPRVPPAPGRLVVGQGGRVVIPAPYREALGVDEGDELSVRFEDGEIRLTTPGLALRRAQEMLRRYVPAGRSLADELIAERRLEAERE
jgi:AbrB family looped-hinge helix DNA binding protein